MSTSFLKIYREGKKIAPSYKYPLPMMSMVDGATLNGYAFSAFAELTIASGGTKYIECVVGEGRYVHFVKKSRYSHADARQR